VVHRYDTISFLSDFGYADEFVGVVHSVIRSLAPEVAVVDVTHGIERHNVRAGGLALARAANYLNPGVVIAVVDPGVGTARRPVALEVGDGASVLLGPDNGLLAPAVGLVGGATRAFDVRDSSVRLPTTGGATFDGRDLFAPVAAHLCRGVPLTELGTEIDPASLMPGVLPVAHADGDELVCEVLWIDHFGNCQLNVDPLEALALGSEIVVKVDGEDWVGVPTEAYESIPAGRVGLLTDSSGLLSMAIARGSAATMLSLAEGSEIRLRALDETDRPSVSINTPVELGPRPNSSGVQTEES